MSAYWDNQAPLGGAWHLGNAAIAYTSNGLGVESLKMAVGELMKMHHDNDVNTIIGRGRSTSGSTRKLSFYVEVDESNTADLRLFEGFAYLAEDGKML